jgi:hypothetical protein
MNRNLKILSLFASTLFLAACGGGGSSIEDLATSHAISGQVQQGNIKGATVFLDLNGNGVQDAGEPASTTTGTDGKFTLSLNGAQAAALNAAPSTAKIVSVGGTDTTTGLEAGLLVSDVAPVTGASTTKNVTAMTTLVAMTPDAKKADLKTVLGTLGLKDSSGKANDDSLIETSTPAVIALSKGVESALLNVKKATSDTVARAAAAEMGKALATKTAAEITDTAALSTTLSTAAGTALTNSGSVPAGQVTTMVDTIGKGCKEVTDLVKANTGGTLSTEDHPKTESEIMTTVGGQIRTSVETSTAEVETESHHGTTTTTTTTTTGGTTTDTGTGTTADTGTHT